MLVISYKYLYIIRTYYCRREENILIRKLLIVGIIILFIGSVFTTAIGNTIEQPSISMIAGDILYVGGNGPGNYSSIQDAIDNASNEDTIFVYDDSSPYYENVIVNKSVDLIGEDKDTTIIDGSSKGNVVSIVIDDVTVSWFTIQNSGNGVNANGIDVRSNQNDISENKILNNKRGILLYYSSNNTISKNNISLNNWDGIYIVGGYYNSIIDNIIDSNKDKGMILYFTKNSYIANNAILNSEDGMYFTTTCTNIFLFNNTISSNKYYGMLISNSHNLSIKSNTITKNQIGILPVLYSSYLNITNNMLSKNVIGILPYISSNNTIFQNNFYNNLINAFFKDCTNIWINNYWSRPRLYPKPIFGLVKTTLPYPSINFDMDPAEKPFDI